MHGQSSPNFLGGRAKAPAEAGVALALSEFRRLIRRGCGYAAITLDRPVNNCHVYYLWQELIPVDYELFR